jgi:hypothetical protein
MIETSREWIPIQTEYKGNTIRGNYSIEGGTVYVKALNREKIGLLGGYAPSLRARTMIRQIAQLLCQHAHRVGEGQRRAIVGKVETSRNAPGLVTQPPVRKFRKIACAFARC